VKQALALAAFISVHILATPAGAAEPLVGLWRLELQEIDGQKQDFEPMALKVTQSGEALSLAFSVPVTDIYFVVTAYTVRLDGSTADVKNANDRKVGTVQLTRAGARQYKLTMKGPNRPDTLGRLTVSPDGRTLISESDATQSGRSTHSRQIFARYE